MNTVHKLSNVFDECNKINSQGALENGQVFDSSRQPGREPFSVQLGVGQVIKGIQPFVQKEVGSDHVHLEWNAISCTV